MALAVKRGSPHLAASAADVRVVAEPCHTRGAPAKGRGVVVVGSVRGARKRPDQVTPSSSNSHWSSSDSPKSGGNELPRVPLAHGEAVEAQVLGTARGLHHLVEPVRRRDDLAG